MTIVKCVSDMKILIVDQDEIVSKALEQYLRGKGHTPKTTVDGKKALASYSKDDFDIAIISRTLPEMTGLTLVQKLREYDEAYDRRSYLILVADKDYEGDILDGLGAGLDDFLTKPYDFEMLENRIKIASWEMNPLNEREEKETSPIQNLLSDHKMLRSFISILEHVEADFDNGIPDHVLDWVSQTGNLMNMDVHEEKEKALTNALVEKLIVTHGEDFGAFSKTSLDRIEDEHLLLYRVLTKMKRGISRRIEKNRGTLERTASRLKDVKRNGKDPFSTREILMEIRHDIEGCINDTDNDNRVIKNLISEYAALLRAHMALEEDTFFPFAERYLDDDGRREIVSQFKEIEKGAGLDKIRRHKREIEELEKVLAETAR